THTPPEPTLFPYTTLFRSHLTVEDNIAFPLSGKTMDEAARNWRVREVAQMLGLAHVLHRKPAQLSGGQRQRVAMARAMVRRRARSEEHTSELQSPDHLVCR